MKELSKRDRLKALIAPNMIDIIILLDKMENKMSKHGETFIDSIVI